MIVKMKKAFIVGRGAAREELLKTLRGLGVVHLEPADLTARAPEALLAELEKVRRAGQIIGGVAPAGEAPATTARDAVEEIMAISRRTEEGRGRLNALAREAERLKIWGGLRREQLEVLSAAGVPVKFYSVSEKALEQVQAECIALLAELAGKRRLVAVIQRAGEPVLPEGAEAVETPDRDLPTVQAEAKQIDSAMKADAEKLAQLANLAAPVAAEQQRLEAEVELAAARAGALKAGDLFAVQGWAPADAAGTLASDLAARGMSAAVDLRDPQGDEQPPTLIRYARWTRPIKGLFDILGTLPGYREVDVSIFFMVALPLFAAMLIGDAGYGLLLIVAPALFYRKLAPAVGKAKAQLLIVFGCTTLIWGILTGNYFGVTPNSIASAGGWVTENAKGEPTADIDSMLAAGGGWATVGKAMVVAAPLWDTDSEKAREILMKVSFIIGVVHLCLAQLRRATALAPDLRALAPVGWTVFLVGMFGVIWDLMFHGIAEINWGLYGIPLMIGGGLAVLFTHPDRNPLKMIGIGLASSLLPAIGAFSDTMSYIRLMAVGLASYYIAAAFNDLASQLADVATWFLAAPVLILGHGLNIAMAMIAIFAHGVRLNMLEFSNNAGVQWGGYAYVPFATNAGKET